MKEMKKKSLVGLIGLSFLTGGGLTYAGTQLTWGGEDNVSSIKTSIDKLTSEIGLRDAKVKDTEKTIEDLSDKKNNLDKIILEKEDKLKELTDKINNLETEVVNQKQLVKDTETKYVNQINESNEIYKLEYDKYVSEINDLNLQLQKLTDEKASLSYQLSELKESHDLLKTDSDSKDEKLSKANSDVKDLKEYADKAVESVTSSELEK